MSSVSDSFIVEEIPVSRIRHGEWYEDRLRVSYHPESFSLEIAGKYRKTKEVWAEVDLYRVESIPVQAPFVGSAYILHRSPTAIADDPNHIQRYETLVGPTEAKDSCSCRGHYKTERCKHADALRWLGSKLNPPSCSKCGQTDCELVGGLCSDCVAFKPQAKAPDTEPDWLKSEAAPDYDEIPF